MIVKFLQTRNGGGVGSVNYLLNERTQQGTARILKGNESQTRAIINQIQFKQKTTFGVLSFSEKAADISDEIKQEIIKDFERHLLGDYMKERVNVLWVEHSDKDGRLELNFVIPKIDLVSGKSFNPYFDQRDRTNINLWKRTINDEYNFHSPDDPKHQYNQNRHKATLKQHNTITELDNTLKELVAQGVIKNRSHLIELLNTHGYEVTRQPESGISVKLPNQKKAFRLKGGIYSADFTNIDKLSELGETQSRRIQQYANRDTQAECIENRKRLENFISKRDEYNRSRYKENIRENAINNDRHKSRNNKPNGAELDAKNFQWHSAINSDDIFNSRIFSVFLAQSQRDRILSSRERTTESREQHTERMANSSRLSLHTTEQPNTKDRTLSIPTTANADTKTRWQSISATLWGLLDDTARNRIIKRSGEIAKRNKQIAENDNNKAKREREISERLRKIAREQNDTILQRLSREFYTRCREYYKIAQERAKRIREQAKRDSADQDKFTKSFNDINNGLQQITRRIQSIANGIHDIRNRLSSFAAGINSDKEQAHRELAEYGKRVSNSIQRFTNDNGQEFSSKVESTAKSVATAGGLEIRRELQRPERQRLVELTREKIRQRQKIRMRF